MKITITQDEVVLKEIELTNLQFKSIRFTAGEPEDYIVYKLGRILEFAVNQAKQKYAKYKLDKATDEEMEAIADEVAEEEKEEL